MRKIYIEGTGKNDRFTKTPDPNEEDPMTSDTYDGEHFLFQQEILGLAGVVIKDKNLAEDHIAKLTP